jgi:hypothetical protein
MASSLRRKISPASIVAPAKSARPLRPAPAASRPAYAALFVALRPQARALGLGVALTIAPLGALTGLVSACGGAGLTEPYSQYDSGVAEPDTFVTAPDTGVDTSDAGDAGETGSDADAEADADAGPGTDTDAAPSD